MSVNTPSLRTGAKIVERAGYPIAADQMRAAANEIDRLREAVASTEAFTDKVGAACNENADERDRLRARCAELEKAIDEFSTIALSLPTYPRPGVGGQTTEETAKATLIRGVSVWQVETLLSTLQGQDNGR